MNPHRRAPFPVLALAACLALAAGCGGAPEKPAPAPPPATASPPTPAPFPAAGLREGDLVAICGDSITEQGIYSVFMEAYLLACQPAPKLRVLQSGLGGETAAGFLERMDRDVLAHRPVAVTTCYGMNDGGYGPYAEAVGRAYGDATREMVRRFRRGGVRLVVVGSPGCVDSGTFGRAPGHAALYNATLARLGEAARAVAGTEGAAFADLHGPMVAVMAAAKARWGRGYHLAGADGVHPAANGHLVMAWALLKALGCDGDLGSVTVDLAAGRAEAAGGHAVLAFRDGAVEIESRRYPFCLYGEKSAPEATTGIVELFPLHADLNRLTLKVTGARAARLRVTWGGAAREISAEELARGVNLAAEFPENPFSVPFATVLRAAAEKQAFETEVLRGLGPDTPEFARAMARRRKLAAAVAAAVKPVRYVLEIREAGR